MKILMSLIFYPRGGSAQVARYLSRALLAQGHDVHLVTGTLKDGDPHHDAEDFFEGIPLTTVDYTEAGRGFERGENPMSPDWATPFHPSYEDKPGVPDRAFFEVSDREYRGMVECWARTFEETGERFRPDVLHLHHLSHAHEAAALTFPSVPKLTQLHGTEIKMLERLDELGQEPGGSPEQDPIARKMLFESVEISDHFAAISPDIRDRGINLLGIPESRITTVPNGVDTTLFRPLAWSNPKKLQFLNRILVEDPQGWSEGGTPGSIRYQPSDLERFTDSSGSFLPLALFVGRFLDFKRVPLLVRALSKANGLSRDAHDPPFNLLVWGGMPGEWEGEHPHSVALSLELPNVFFCGWLPHGILSQGLNLADLLVAPSHNEPFGQVYIEAMATGAPVIATKSGGPLDFVVGEGPQANGWFAGVDDLDSLARTLHQALGEEAERKRRGANALSLVRGRYDWKAIAGQYADLYRQMSG
ncbi:MAG: glycosyltransferase family 4 protein [Gemmatimonadetes bacterium]|nr:glycosyltransferase family 4 protein [Gemmatimonadota bacterium]NNM05373.1 glycosyltransferase family 4 protein [Gemmatimonadota bacterium]